MTLSKLFRKSEEPAAPVPAPVAALPPDEAALAEAVKRHDAGRERLEGLRTTRADLRERAGSLSDQRAMLLRKLASGDDVQDELDAVTAALEKLRALAEGTDSLIGTGEAEEHAAIEALRVASEPVTRRKREEAIAAATAAANAAAARFYDLFGQTSVAIADLEDALDHLGSVGGDPANYGRALTAYGRDPLTKLMQSGWKLRDTRTSNLPRSWVVSALIPPEQG